MRVSRGAAAAAATKCDYSYDPASSMRPADPSRLSFRLDFSNFGCGAVEDLGNTHLVLGGDAAQIEQHRLERRARAAKHRIGMAQTMTPAVMSSVAAAAEIVLDDGLAQTLHLHSSSLDLRDC